MDSLASTSTSSETHVVSMIAQTAPDSETFRVTCFCGASWTINKQEKEAGETKIDWHIKYANRPKTRVD